MLAAAMRVVIACDDLLFWQRVHHLSLFLPEQMQQFIQHVPSWVNGFEAFVRHSFLQ